MSSFRFNRVCRKVYTQEFDFCSEDFQSFVVEACERDWADRLTVAEMGECWLWMLEHKDAHKVEEEQHDLEDCGDEKDIYEYNGEKDEDEEFVYGEDGNVPKSVELVITGWLDKWWKTNPAARQRIEAEDKAEEEREAAEAAKDAATDWKAEAKVLAEKLEREMKEALEWKRLAEAQQRRAEHAEASLCALKDGLRGML